MKTTFRGGMLLLLLTTVGQALVPPSRPSVHLQRSHPTTLLPTDFLSEKNPRKRKRDLVFPWRTTSRRSRSRGAALLSKPNDDKDDNDDEDHNDMLPAEQQPQASSNSTTLLATWQTNLTTQLSQAKQTAMEQWNKIKYWLLSFLAGVTVAGAVLLVPIYSQVQSLTQPVTLFETILSDLEQAYVDPVDTNKLFETGVAAMLRSLDPYTEFEGKEDAVALVESIDGKYGGVGLVIAGSTGKQQQQQKSTAKEKLLPAAAQQDNAVLKDGENNNNNAVPIVMQTNDDQDFEYLAVDAEDDDEDVYEAQLRLQESIRSKKAQEQGIRVVSAFEGYAFDYGMRVGDKLVAIDDSDISPGTTVEQVRNVLRGEAGTLVTIRFERDGVDGVQSVTMPRAVVQLRDVKLAALLGNPADGIGYIQLSGFASDTGREIRNAIQYLQRATEDATLGERSLQGLVLDLRGNPGGLLTSAVDVCSLLVPKGSDIVSAKGRGFPGILYRSRVDPILDPNTKLAVLVNGNTASASEILAGAIQDLDVGVVVGNDRTFGKGLVQNVESLPFDTALKFTVAKYYTPSGRCIQGVNYKEGGGLNGDAKYVASKVAEKDRAAFYTKGGRVVRDGGGIEADYKVAAPKASALEVTLLRSGALNEFASQWSKTHELTNNFEVDEDTYKQFQSFVAEKQRKGELQLELFYSKPLTDLKKALKQSGYGGAEKSVEQLQARIIREVQNDFEKYRSDIKEDISQSILARYLPESMLIERSVKNDVQVKAAVKLLSDDKHFDKLLARGPSNDSGPVGNTLNMASGSGDETSGLRGKLKW